MRFDRKTSGREPRPLGPALVAACGLVLLVHVAAAAGPSNFTWGLAVLRYWPPAQAAALLALALVGFVPAFARGIVRGLDALGRAAQRAPLVAGLVVAALVVALALSFPDPVRFVGDHALRVGALDTDLTGRGLFPQAFPLDLLFNIDLARALVHNGLEIGRAHV